MVFLCNQKKDVKEISPRKTRITIRVGFEIGIFYFLLDQKIPKIPKSKNPESKIPKIHNPRDRDLDMKIPKKFRENSKRKIPKIKKIPGSGFIFESRDFNPRDPGLS